MKLKYAGLKPIINEHGISFKDGKEDKYIYLTFAIDVLQSINHRYEKNKKYSHELKEQKLEPQEILLILERIHPELENTMMKEISEYELLLDKEELRISELSTLNKLEKDTYIKNLRIMRDYRIQRMKNKIFYMHCIETIVELIIHHKIKEIDTPFNERFWHILHSIQGDLMKNKISSKLNIKEINELQKAVLDIDIY